MDAKLFKDFRKLLINNIIATDMVCLFYYFTQKLSFILIIKINKKLIKIGRAVLLFIILFTKINYFFNKFCFQIKKVQN